MGYGFEWYSAKASSNLKKHKVSFEEASTVFDDPLAKVFGDDDHSDNEDRELIFGHSSLMRLLVVSYVERNARIRLISARLATPRERQAYEKTKEN